MLLTVSEFRERVLGSGLFGLIEELAQVTGRRNPAEFKSWQDSFVQIGRSLDSSSLAQVHLYLGDLGNLSLEYRLPASSSWCDLVLLGHDGRRPSAVIVELKHWDTRGDRARIYGGLIDRPSGLTLHPSEQVKGYAEYCRNFHSAFHDVAAGDSARANLDACVIFTARSLNRDYIAGPNESLSREYPCFSVATSHEAEAALQFLNLRLVRPDVDFARRFETGTYRQKRNFVEAIGQTLKRSPHRRIELLDEQRKGFLVALASVRDALGGLSGPRRKRVVVIEGPPGSGKSAIAARLWAELATMPDLPTGDIAFVTTSQAQNQSMEHLFGAGYGAVKKASHFTPATTMDLGRLKRKFPGQFDDVEQWRLHLETLRKLKGELQPADDAYLVSIIDEAHALINPEYRDARGQFGFAVNFGPQAFHIIRASTVSVFLLDEQQGFRERENTTRADIEKWAAELGAEVIPHVSLKDHQFRCGGASEYIDWVDGLVGPNRKTPQELVELAAKWREPGFAQEPEIEGELSAESDRKVVPFLPLRRSFTCEVLENPAELEAVVAAHGRDGRSVRLVASYARDWVTEDAVRPHGLPPQMQDFCISWKNQSGPHTWARIWNWKNAPEGYVGWIDPSPGVPMAENPLAEVGCPYTVRGFDYDYLGVLWMSDVIWRTDRWIVKPEHVFETGLSRHLGRARKDSVEGPEREKLLRKMLQGYRILLTRALRGVYIWCEDEPTRYHLARCLGQKSLEP